MKREITTASRSVSEQRGVILGIILTVMVMVAALMPADVKARRGYHDDRMERVRYVLHFGDARYHGGRGNPSILFLKKELLRQYPGVNVSNLRLHNVTLVAKTRIGRGVAQLRVGPEITDLYQVAGRPRDFYSGNRYSFDRVRIHNPYRQSWGPWQLHLTGNFKVRKVVLIVEDRPRPQYGKRGAHRHRQFDGLYFGWRW